MEQERKKPFKMKVFGSDHHTWVYPGKVIILARMRFKHEFLKELNLMETGTYKTRIPETGTNPVIEFTILHSGLSTKQEIQQFFKTEKLSSMAKKNEKKAKKFRQIKR